MSSRTLVRRVAAASLFSVAGYYALLGGEYSAFDLLRLRGAQAEETARLAAVRAEADSLAELVKRLEGDRPTIEAVARERFGMIREGEILYRFVETGDSAAQGEKAP